MHFTQHLMNFKQQQQQFLGTNVIIFGMTNGWIWIRQAQSDPGCKIAEI